MWRCRCRCRRRLLNSPASTTAAATETTTPQMKDLIGRVRKNNYAARAARSYEQVRAFLFEITT